MSIFSNPFAKSKPHSGGAQSADTAVADEIIAFVTGFVNREDLIADILSYYEKSKALDHQNRSLAAIGVYIRLESFVVRNKQLIVKVSITKEELREKIRTQFAISQLQDDFRLLFVPQNEQSELVYSLGAKQLTDYILKNMGIAKLNVMLEGIEDGPMHDIVKTTDGLDFAKLTQALKTVTGEEEKQQYSKLYSVLLTGIENSLGHTVSEKVVSDIYSFFKSTYDYDVIATFLEIVPQEYLVNERIRGLSRQEIENKIQTRTKELSEARIQLEQKLAVINKQNAELLAAKTALTDSLTEEKRLEGELKKEKDLVEEKVKERTAQLEEKTQELNTTLATLKESYQQTENERARLSASIDGLSLGFVLTDVDDKIIAINKTLYQNLKCGPDKTFSTIAQLSEFLDIGPRFIDKYQASKKDHSQQMLNDINFSNIFLRFFFTPVMVSSDTCIGVALMVEDITEAKLLERSKDEFFAVASHELRTPLTAIRGYASLILDNFPEKLQNDPALTKMITNIHKSAIRLINIVNDFLDASKLEQGKVTITMTEADLSPVIESVMTDVSELVNSKHIYLRFEKPNEEIGKVSTDPEKLKQVIINLVGNAIKFTSEGGITIHMKKQDKYVRVLVSDTGLGISEEYRALLFRKFQQAGERILTRDAATGSGMGLYISKLLMETMKGEIGIEETVLGKGSTFYVMIPVV